jgi:hypothetical protein
MREQDKLDEDVYMQQFPHSGQHLYTPEVKQPEWYEVQAAQQQAAQQQAPQQGQFGAGSMGQQFNLGGVPQAQSAMVPAPQPMQPMQQTAQQASMPYGNPISAMT